MDSADAKIVRIMTPADRMDKVFNDLFPLNRSLTGDAVAQTFSYIREHFLADAEVKYIESGSSVFDWTVPDEWRISDAFVMNAYGEKIIDFSENNLHVVGYSAGVNKVVDEDELRQHLHTLPNHPSWIPYRTTYYHRDWGFCCSEKLVQSDKFVGPFKVYIDAHHNTDGLMNWLEYVKPGETSEEILVSTYCCHPSLANDNLSGLILALFLFEHLSMLNTRFTYRLVVVPETIGAITFLSQADTKKIKAGMVLSCVAGPDKMSLKEGFDTSHWINKAAHLALQSKVGTDYITYPFVPNGSDERQYSSPGFRIVTPSIHKSKYCEYIEYHTSADNLDYVSTESLIQSLDIYKSWIDLIESYCMPKRVEMRCEYQLGKRGLYPSLGGTLNQQAHTDNREGPQNRTFDFNRQVELTGAHIDAFNWLMHLSDGSLSNFDIAERSGLGIDIVNEAIAAMHQKNVLELL